MYTQWYKVERNPDYSETFSTKTPITCRVGCKSTKFKDVSRELWERDCPKYGAAPYSYMQLECEQGHKKTLYRNSVKEI